jgi:hypothetical protein
MRKRIKIQTLGEIMHKKTVFGLGLVWSLAILITQISMALASSDPIFPKQCKNLVFPFEMDIHDPTKIYSVNLVLELKDEKSGLPKENEFYHYFPQYQDPHSSRITLDWSAGSRLGNFEPMLFWHSIEIGGLQDWKTSGMISLWIKTWNQGEVTYTNYPYQCR